MRLVLFALNALAVAAGAIFFALALVYGRPGDWGTRDAIRLCLLLAPFLAALFALRQHSSSLAKSFAAWCNAAWAVLLAVLGVGASTGIGGLIGLLIVIIPAFLALSLNWVGLLVLRSQKATRLEA